MRIRLSHPAIGAALISLVVAFAGCPGPDGPGAPGDVIYLGGTNDEVWISMDEAAEIVGDTDAPMLTAPVGPVARSSPVAFTWTAGALEFSAARRRVFRDELLALFTGPSRAQAHGTPYTGVMFRVIVEVPGGAVVRVLTASTSWTPDEPTWARLTGGGSPLTVEITGAYATLNRIDEGPYVRTAPATVELE